MKSFTLILGDRQSRKAVEDKRTEFLVPQISSSLARNTQVLKLSQCEQNGDQEFIFFLYICELESILSSGHK